MKSCAKCNLEFPDAFSFCGACGGALATLPRCPSCGEVSDGKWPYCTSCGAKISSEGNDRTSISKTYDVSTTPRTPPPPTLTMPAAEQPPAINRQREETTNREWYSVADLYDEETVTAAPAPPQQSRVIAETKSPAGQVVSSHPANDTLAAPALTMLSAYGEPEPLPQFRWWHGMILGFFVLLLVGGLGVGGWYWWSHRGSAVQVLGPANSTPGTSTESTVASPLPSPTSTAATVQVSHSADDEIKRLRERRIAAKPSEGADMISTLEQAEKKYPNDYRFPYELSKLSIKGIISHHEAFEPLARAAEKAIENGKAAEMLNDLSADQDGDFYKLSRGHREWQALMQALSNKDKRGLSEMHH